jgi:hypothetical protein
MRTITISIFIAVFIISIGHQTFGEEWTQDQKEIWSVIQADWEANKNGDVESTLTCRHDKVLSIYSYDSSPYNKDQIRTSNQYWLYSDDRPTSYNIKPIAIGIIDNVAIVFYWYEWRSDLTGSSDKGRSMNTLIKLNNKWVTVGSMDASCIRPAPRPYRANKDNF